MSNMRTNGEFSAGNRIFAFFLLLGLLGLLGLWLAFHPKSPMRPYRNYSILFSDIGTLRAGNAVQALGIRKGQVGAIEMHDEGITVVIKVDREYDIPDDSRFRIINTGLLGQREVEIRPGHSKTYLQSGASLLGSFDYGSTRLAFMVGNLLLSANQLIEASLAGWDSTLGDPNAQRRFSTLGRNTKQTVGRFKNDVGQWRDSLLVMRDEFQICASRLDSLQQALKPGIDTVAGNARDLGQRLDSLELRLRSLQSRVVDVTGQLKPGEPNSASLLLHNKEMQAQVSSIIAEVRALVVDVKRKGLDMNVDIF